MGKHLEEKENKESGRRKIPAKTQSSRPGHLTRKELSIEDNGRGNSRVHADVHNEVNVPSIDKSLKNISLIYYIHLGWWKKIFVN